MALSKQDIMDAIPNPLNIIEELDKYIVGQGDAKRCLSVMLMNRALLRLNKAGVLDINCPIDKSNVLLIGPTGSGKTALVKALARVAGIGISTFDVTSITSAGYVGGKVEDILIRHIKLCENEGHPLELGGQDFSSYSDDYLKEAFVEVVETGILHLDEIDKIRRRTNSSNNTDINGELVQNELLKILEGGTIDFSPAKDGSYSSSLFNVRTHDMFFILGGAFEGLSEIIAQRINKDKGMGFHSKLKIDKSEENILKYVINQDLIDYGLKPEFLGRIPLRSVLDTLDEDTLAEIITNPKDSILKQYQNIFKVFDINLIIDKEAINEIAKMAFDLKMGARSLKTIFSNVLLDSLVNIFTLKEKEFIITKELVLKEGSKHEI